MLVSVAIPACAAAGTIGRAVRSLIDQTLTGWEAVIVSDDGADYQAILAAEGITDPRLRFTTTGKVRSGCHRARNAGFAAVRGAVVATLDADDAYAPDRLALLVPLALDHGAAGDNTGAIDDVTGAPLSTPLDHPPGITHLSIESFLATNVPISTVVRRELLAPRLEGVEFAEDVIANLRLIDRLGSLPIHPDSLYIYRVRAGSICHDPDSARVADDAYAMLIERLTRGDGLDLGAEGRRRALPGLAAKKALNLAFDQACRRDPTLNFQSFVAGAAARG